MSDTFEKLSSYIEYSPSMMQKRSTEFYNLVNRRRTVRDFSKRPVSRKIIENCIRSAGTAPSGANQQPWHFAIISDLEMKRKIRLAAEKKEKSFYRERVSEEWLNALKPLGTNEQKPFIELAPYLIAIFEQKYGWNNDGSKKKHYYSNESTGIATGLLITALHYAGLATLTYTPSPMSFLNVLLNRPQNERPFLLLVVGYPNDDTNVPRIKRKELSEISSFY